MTNRGLGIVEAALVSASIQGAVRDSYQMEELKGCDPRIALRPVKIVPRFQEYRLRNLLSDRQEEVNLVPIWDDTNYDNLVFLRIWLSPKDKCKWLEFENVWKEILVIKQPINSINIADRERISFFIGVDSFYALTIEKVLKAHFPHCEVDILKENIFIKKFKEFDRGKYELSLREFFPQQPYFKNLNLFEQGLSPISSLYSGCFKLEPPEFAFYQILSIGIGPEWRANIINLLEAEHEAGRYGSIAFGASHSGGYGLEDYKDGRKKIDPNQSLCAVVIRLGVVCRKDRKGIIENLSSTIEKFSFGGMPFRYLTENDYEMALGDKGKLIEMIANGLTYRSGIILTAQEITQLWHFPSTEVLERPDYKFDKLTGLKAPAHIAKGGVILGYNEYAGKKTIIRQDETRLTNKHVAIIGLTGRGKTILIENMVLEDIGDAPERYCN